MVYRTFNDPQERVPNTVFFYDFLANSFSPDGKGFTLIFTGTGKADALNLVDGSFTTAGAGGGGNGNGNGNGNGGGSGQRERRWWQRQRQRR